MFWMINSVFVEFWVFFMNKMVEFYWIWKDLKEEFSMFMEFESIICKYEYEYWLSIIGLN